MKTVYQMKLQNIWKNWELSTKASGFLFHSFFLFQELFSHLCTSNEQQTYLCSTDRHQHHYIISITISVNMIYSDTQKILFMEKTNKRPMCIYSCSVAMRFTLKGTCNSNRHSDLRQKSLPTKIHHNDHNGGGGDFFNWSSN